MDNSHTRPHYQHQTTNNNNNNNSSELFICFTSALSSTSSSMKISKSILSPGRCRDQPMSLSSSLSRRFKSNGSLKGGQASPIFTKKRGFGFENPEPSSPKVTCIGQVRVKTKKKAKQTRTLSRRRSGGDVSSRRLTDQGSAENEKGILGNVSSHYTRANSSTHQQDCLPHRNQRWVHLPLTICEALRDFGAEFSCLFPCSSSCFSTTESGKEEKRNNNNNINNNNNNGDSCFARWLVTLQDEEGGKEREIELVVGGDEEEEESGDDVELRSSRRHVLEDFKISDEIFDGKSRRVGEEGRMSICIPPKNALLLMRCRSDPMKMASLTTKVWEAPPPQVEDEGEMEKVEVFDGKRSIFGEEVVKEIDVDVDKCEVLEEVKEMVLEIQNLDSIEVEEVFDLPMQVQDEENIEDKEEETEVNMSKRDLLQEKEKEKEEELIFMEALEAHIRNIENEDISVQETELENCVLLEQEANIKNTENEDPNQIVEKEEEGCRISCASFSSAINQEDGENEEVETEEEAAEAETESTSEKESTFNTEPQLENQTEDFGNSHENEEVKDQEMKTSELKIEEQTENEEEVFERRDQFMIEDNDEAVEKLSSLVSSSPKSSVLPDCLLLMMYEPKLSMEVSKETWVCSRDFSRWLPQRHKHVKQPVPSTVAKNDDPIMENSDEVKKRNSTDSKSSLNKKSQSPHQAKQAAVAAAPPLEPQTALLPPRSSCSYPVAAVSMATMIEQKLVNAVGYEPFVLTRCKSEPMRPAGKLASAQDGCFWTKRKLEPLRRAAYHAGTTRVGF